MDNIRNNLYMHNLVVGVLCDDNKALLCQESINRSEKNILLYNISEKY